MSELAKPGDGWTHGEWDFPICICGHAIEKHEPEQGYPFHDSPIACEVEGCGCGCYVAPDELEPPALKADENA